MAADPTSASARASPALEMTALFGELARRCERIELTGPVGRLRSSFINGIKTLPVRLDCVTVRARASTNRWVFS